MIGPTVINLFPGGVWDIINQFEPLCTQFEDEMSVSARFEYKNARLGTIINDWVNCVRQSEREKKTASKSAFAATLINDGSLFRLTIEQMNTLFNEKLQIEISGSIQKFTHADFEGMISAAKKVEIDQFHLISPHRTILYKAHSLLGRERLQQIDISRNYIAQKEIVAELNDAALASKVCLEILVDSQKEVTLKETPNFKFECTLPEHIAPVIASSKTFEKINLEEMVLNRKDIDELIKTNKKVDISKCTRFNHIEPTINICCISAISALAGLITWGIATPILMGIYGGIAFAASFVTCGILGAAATAALVFFAGHGIVYLIDRLTIWYWQSLLNKS